MNTRMLLGFLILGSLASCATNPAMENYIERKIDRPFVNADGISTFAIIGNGSFSRDVVGREAVTYPIPFPVYYTFTLFENISMDGAVIPLAINWQIENNNSGFWGLSAGAGFGTSPYFGFHYDPTIAVSRKIRLSDSQALLGVFRLLDVIYTDGGPTTIGADLSLATEFQLTSRFWVQAGLGASTVHTSSYSKTVGSYQFWTDDGLKTEFPAFAGISWTLFRTLDLNAKYSFHYLGRTNGTFEHDYSLGLVVVY